MCIRLAPVLILLSVVLVVDRAVAASPLTPVTCTSPADKNTEPTQYFVSLKYAEKHLAHVSIRVPESTGKLTFNMPVWNSLYQVRNFAADVEDVRAQDAKGAPLLLKHTSTSEWQVSATGGCFVVSYAVHLDTPGPFGATLDKDHGFFNWAMVLMYSADLRNLPARLQLLDVPEDWKVRDLHVLVAAEPGQARQFSGIARNYDELVDSPAEAGIFQHTWFQQDGATYHIVVHGNASDYDAAAMQSTLEKITHTAVDWMQDRPYDEYTFIYHVPNHPVGGGMEHAYGTAISIGSARLRDNHAALGEVTAHEFFHLWNVKRIRPQSLEPIDYQHEQDTSALWFSEGVTSAVSNVLLVRAGLSSEQEYLANLGRAITELQLRPAHAWQSAEDSSRDAWFEDSSFYLSPERSVSYYNKGEILGVLLDLRLRELTQGGKSLRDLFQWMNQAYAKQHRFFDDSTGVLQAAEEVVSSQPGSEAHANSSSLPDFFRDYVAGVKEIPYADFFGFVGLRVVTKSREVASVGFSVTANPGAQPEVSEVEPDSEAQRQGLAKGDVIVALNGKTISSFEDDIAGMHPSDTITVTIKNRGRRQDAKLRLGSRLEQWFELQDLPSVTPQQRAHRTAWIHGEDEVFP